jgi:hypothetical protein
MSLILDERRLDPQAVERLPGMQPGDAIVCTCGMLWVTQEGDPEDYVLQKGSAFVAKRQGVVVVQTLTKATYRLSSNDKPRAGEAFRMPALGLSLLEAAFGDWRQKGITRGAGDYDRPAGCE